MNHLIKRKLNLNYIPDCLAKDFEGMLLDAYFKGWHDLRNLSNHTDIFILYRQSYLETGDEFLYEKDEQTRNKFDYLMEQDKPYITEDVRRILEYHHMFYADTDKGNWGNKYIWRGFHNLPYSEVW